MSEKVTLVVTSKVKAYMKENGMRCSGDAIDALSMRVREICDEAIVSARAGKKVTVQGKDIS